MLKTQSWTALNSSMVLMPMHDNIASSSLLPAYFSRVLTTISSTDLQQLPLKALLAPNR